MKLFNQKSATTVLLSTSILMASGLPSVVFSQDESPWSIKAYSVIGSADESFSADRAGGRVESSDNALFGFGGAVEYRLNDRIGLEVAGSYSVVPDIDYDTDDSNTEVGEGPSFAPLQFAVNFHVINTDKLDLYAGPRIAFVIFDDFDLDVDGQRVDYEVDNEFGVGATAGVSYQLGNGPVALTAEISYLAVEMNVTEKGTTTKETIDFNPVSTNLGITYQF